MEDLLDEIRRVFPATPVPRAEDLVDCSTGDDYCREISANLGNRPWTEIPTGTLEHYNDALPFLTDVGFRYLLPAFLVASRSSESNLIDFVVAGLCPSKGQVDRLTALRPTFSPDQRHAIVRFLGDLPAEDGWYPEGLGVTLPFWQR